MALIECKECGKSISDKAGACPNCGAPIQQSTMPPVAETKPVSQPTPAPKKKRSILWYILGAIVLVGVLGAIFGPSESERKAKEAEKIAAIEAAKTPEQRAAEAKAKEEKEKEMARQKEEHAKAEEAKANAKALENQRAARVFAVTKVIRESARNPKSVEFTKVLSDDTGDLLCIQFRAQNGFGGMNLEHYAVTKTKTYNGAENPDAYNKACVGKKLNDVKYAAQ